MFGHPNKSIGGSLDDIETLNWHQLKSYGHYLESKIKQIKTGNTKTMIHIRAHIPTPWYIIIIIIREAQLRHATTTLK
jgi:hypothetical protein